MAGDESASFVRNAIVDITPEAMSQLEADVKRLAVDFLHRPPYLMVATLAERRRSVLSLIDRHPRPSLLASLYRLAGQLSGSPYMGAIAGVPEKLLPTALLVAVPL